MKHFAFSFIRYIIHTRKGIEYYSALCFSENSTIYLDAIKAIEYIYWVAPAVTYSHMSINLRKKGIVIFLNKSTLVSFHN